MLNKLIVFILCIVAFASSMALEGESHEDPNDAQMVKEAAKAIAITNPSKPIVIRSVSPIFSINLSENVTTGYQWYLVDYNPRLMKLLGQQFFKDQTKLVGSPGISSWQFQLQRTAFNAPQSTRVTFEYRRPWESKAIKKESFTIMSEPNASNSIKRDDEVNT